jgi:hypothetical protein
MQMLFLVEVVVDVSPYMGVTEREQHRRLVQAESADQAYEKAVNYFESQSRDYEIHYAVIHCEVFETIV